MQPNAEPNIFAARIASAPSRREVGGATNKFAAGASLLSALGVAALATRSQRAYSDALATLLARGAPAPLRARRSRAARRAQPTRIEVSLGTS